MDLYFIRDKKGKKGKGKKEKEPSSPNVVTSPNEIDKEFDIVVPEQVHTINKFALVHVLSLSLPPPSLSLSLSLSLFLSLSLSLSLSPYRMALLLKVVAKKRTRNGALIRVKRQSGRGWRSSVRASLL